MIARGVTAPFLLLTVWRATLRAGSMIEDDIFSNWEFWLKSQRKFRYDASLFEEHGKNGS